jgi:hypothetical protein
MGAQPQSRVRPERQPSSRRPTTFFKAGDLVAVDRLGCRFHALVAGDASGENGNQLKRWTFSISQKLTTG